MNKAYPYYRYSTKVQQMGDSERRQEQKAIDFCTAKNLDYDDSFEFHDFGVSAYRGDNLESGKLKTFIELVENGTIAKGSYLVVENFDRFSRQEPRKALKPFLNLIDMGIRIAVVDDNAIHSDTNDSSGLMMSIMYMERAHKESKDKGARIFESKRNAKQAVIDGTRSTLWKWGTPKWMDLAPDRSHYILNDERVAVIKKILAWVIEGRGTTWIIEQLHDVEPWGSSSDIVDFDYNRPKRWYGSQITRIVNNRALFGEIELNIKNDKGNIISAERVPNHFPAVITEEYFNLVQAARQSRRTGSGWGSGGRTGRDFPNLFQKLAVCGYSIENNASGYKCPDDNRPMSYANKDRKFNDKLPSKIYRSRYLQCAASKQKGSSCKSCGKMWRYDDFELSFLTHIKGVDVSTIFGTDQVNKSQLLDIDNQIVSLEQQLDDADKQVDKLLGMLMEYASPALLGQLKKYETLQSLIPTDIDKLKTQRTILMVKFEHGSDSKHQLADTIQLMNESNDENELYELRFKIYTLLKSMIDRIDVYNKGTFIDENTTAQKIERLRLKMGDHPNTEEMLDAIRLSDKQLHGDKPAYFIVHYKSGERHRVQPKPKNPTDLLFNMRYNDEGLIEKPYMKGVEPL